MNTLQNRRGFAACVLMLVAGLAWAEDPLGFPLRAKYPQVPVISTSDLLAQYPTAVIVDVRSQMEFDALRIARAQHVVVTNAGFLTSLEKVRAKDGAATLVFYCNGHDCAKSYDAVDLAQRSGFGNVAVYDAGVFDWVRAHPDKAVLLGQSPAPLTKLLSPAQLAEKSISFADFKNRAQAVDAMVIDIREPQQRQFVPALDKLRNVPSDRMVALLRQGEFKDKQLLIMDAVCKQVEWLQYHLELNGYSNYRFLKGGVAGLPKV